MTHTEALTMALELLAVATYHSPDLQAKRTEVIDAGLKALSSGATVAQPQGGHTFYDANGNVVAHLDATAEITMDYAKPSAWAKAEQPPLNEQELVCVCGAIWKGQELICTPPPVATQHERTWVGLTDEELRQIWYDDAPVEGGTYIDKLRQVEAKLKAKNETTQN